MERDVAQGMLSRISLNQRRRKIGNSSGRLRCLDEIQEIRLRLVAWVLPQHENLNQDKRVESVWFPRVDEGSTPSSSTITLGQLFFEQSSLSKESCPLFIIIHYQANNYL